MPNFPLGWQVGNREHAAEGLTSFAPCRIDLSAGFPDIQPFCDEDEGLVVNLAISSGVTLVASSLHVEGSDTEGKFASKICSLLLAKPANYRVSSTAPRGAGLGSSGATAVAATLLISRLNGIHLSPQRLAEVSWLAERHAGISCGTQDQLASVFGGVGLVRAAGATSRRSPLDVSASWLQERLLVVKPTGGRFSGHIIDRIRSLSGFQRARSIVQSMSDGARILASALQDGNLQDSVEAVNDSRRLLRALSDGIVDARVEHLLRECGVLAAKPCGAGGLGAVWVCLVAPDSRIRVSNAIESSGLKLLPSDLSVTGARIVPPSTARVGA